MTERPTLADVNSANTAGVPVCWATLSLFAKTTNVSYTPRLYAVMAAEVIGEV